MHQLFREFTERSSENSEAAPFQLTKDVFMWAVALGARTGKRLPLSGAKTQIFRWDQLSQDLDVPVLKALVVAETGEVEELLREDQVLRITEEYANMGIREAKKVDRPIEAAALESRRTFPAEARVRVPSELLTPFYSEVGVA